MTTSDNPIRFTDHAVSRYIARIKPALGKADARAELEGSIRFQGELAYERPSWYVATNYVDQDENAVAWLMWGPDICFPLVRDKGRWLVATTCVARGGLPDNVRQIRNDRRKSKTYRRRMAKQLRVGK